MTGAALAFLAGVLALAFWAADRRPPSPPGVLA